MDQKLAMIIAAVKRTAPTSEMLGREQSKH